MKLESPPDAFWLLNPDTVVRDGALHALQDFLASHPKVGICGGGIEEADGKQWPYAFRFPGWISELVRGCSVGCLTRILSRWTVLVPMGSEPARVDWVSGANLVVRSETVSRLGLMDAGYFLYYEETDYCLKAKRAGIECWYLPKCRVMHIAGQSTGVTVRGGKPKRLPAYWFSARRRYFSKNHGRFYAIVADLIWMTSFALSRSIKWVLRKPRDLTPRILTDFFYHSALWHTQDAGNVRAVDPEESQREGASI